MSEKLLPQNVEAEAALLGSILIDPTVLDDVAGTLKPEHFYRDAHRLIYKAALDLHQAGTPPDLITIRDELGKSDKLEEIGGVSTISALSNHVPTSLNAVHYAHIVERTARNRKLIEVAGQIAGSAYGDPDGENALVEAERLIAEVRAGHPTRQPKHKYFMTSEECENMESARGIIGNVLFEDSVAFLYAREGRWKTFLALSWSMSCVTGRKWLGRDVVVGDVVYIAAEGSRGIGKRTRAWKKFHGIEDTPHFHVRPVAVQLLSRAEVRALIAAIREEVGKPVLVVIDTLARSMAGGDENDAKVINQVMDAAYEIKSAFGCCVLIVHHSGKDESRGMRGSSALSSNPDTVMRLVSRDESKPNISPGEPVTLKCEKTKELDAFEDITLTTTDQTWATDAGEIHSSLVIVEGDPSAAREAVPLSHSAQNALDTLYRTPDGLKATEWCAATDLADSSFYALLSTLKKGKYILLDKSTKRYTVTAEGQERVSAAVRAECDRNATEASDNGEFTPVDAEDVDERESGIEAGSPNSNHSDHIGLSEYRSNAIHIDRCPVSGDGRHAYARQRTPDGRRLCIECGAPEAQPGHVA